MSGLPALFLMAVAGVSSPLFTLSGLLPGEPGDRRTVLGPSLKRGLLVLVFALPSHFLLQAIHSVLPGAVWIGTLAPVLLAALFWGIHTLLSRSGFLLWFGPDWPGPTWPALPFARIAIAAAGLVLYPFLDPSLSGMGFLSLTIFFLGNACGYFVLAILLGTVRDRMQMTGLPEFIKGTPVIMVITGLIGFAFLGFVSLLK